MRYLEKTLECTQAICLMNLDAPNVFYFRNLKADDEFTPLNLHMYF